jgi:hypothetical protein
MIGCQRGEGGRPVGNNNSSKIAPIGTVAFQVGSTIQAAQTAPGSGGVLAWALVV